MLSESQIQANRDNARFSTGPRTPDGKTRSSQNARTHGLASRSLFVPDALVGMYNEIVRDYTEFLRPDGPVEFQVFDQMTSAAFMRERALLLQSDLCAEGMDPMADPDLQREFDRLQRYHDKAEARFHRALSTLRRLQSERANREMVSSTDPVPPPFPGLANFRASLLFAARLAYRPIPSTPNPN